MNPFLLVLILATSRIGFSGLAAYGNAFESPDPLAPEADDIVSVRGKGLGEKLPLEMNDSKIELKLIQIKAFTFQTPSSTTQSRVKLVFKNDEDTLGVFALANGSGAHLKYLEAMPQSSETRDN